MFQILIVVDGCIHLLGVCTSSQMGCWQLLNPKLVRDRPLVVKWLSVTLILGQIRHEWVSSMPA